MTLMVCSFKRINLLIIMGGEGDNFLKYMPFLHHLLLTF